MQMTSDIKTPNGKSIDVDAIAEATPEDAFLLLSDETQHELEKLSPSAQQEIGELIIVLADVVAKSDMSIA